MPVTRPTDIGAVGERVYYQLTPYAEAYDADNFWALLSFLGALGSMYQEVDDMASDGPNGEVGYSMLVDINRVPTKGIPWLAQFVGVQLPEGLTDAASRAYVKNAGGWKRGTVGAIVAAAQARLTGTKTVIIRERDPAASPTDASAGLTVITLTGETPNPTQTQADIMAQKPAGIILNYQNYTGQTYLDLRSNNATYAAVRSKYTTYGGLRREQPGT